MFYDVVYRYNEALDRSALTTIAATLHAINAGAADCAAAGRSVEQDPAILRLIHHLGDIARSRGGTPDQLEAACRGAWARTVEHPALLALRGQHLGHQRQAKTTFHYQARRALRVLADQLGLDPAVTRVGSRLGGAGDSGDSALDHPDLLVMVVPWSALPDREVGFYRRRDRCDAGFPMHHAPLPALLRPEGLAAAIKGAIGLGPQPDAPALAA